MKALEKERSLIVIKSGTLDMVSAVLDYISEQCSRQGKKAFIRNMPDGCYEVYEVQPSKHSSEKP